MHTRRDNSRHIEARTGTEIRAKSWLTEAAVRMLRVLGCKRVRLLTNNPAKLDGLAQAGIEVVGRVPLHGPVNADNRRYLTAKATRAGHKLDHLLGAIAEPADAPADPVAPPRPR